MSRTFRFPARLLNRLTELGVSPDAVMRRAGLPASMADERARLSTGELFAFWRAVGELAHEPGMGLVLGSFERPDQLDPIGLAALSTRSFGEAMRQMARHKTLSCPEEIVHHLDGGEWAIHFRWILTDETEPEVLADLCFAWVVAVGRLGTGTRLCPLRVEYARTRSYTQRLERHFGCEVVYGAPRNAIVFRQSDDALPFVTHNAEILAMLAPQLDEEIRQRHGELTFPEQVRSTIQRRLNGRRPRMDEIAREMRLSSRTLQRRLQEENSSFQRVLEEARHQLARHYLGESLLELNEAAYLLGYEDAGSFVRAFRTWEGVPPAHWRGTQRAALMVPGACAACGPATA